MRTIYDIIADIASEFPPDRIRSAIAKLHRMPTRGVPSQNAKSAWGSFSGKPLIVEFSNVAAASGLSPDELACALEGGLASATRLMARQKLDILWTGPQTSAVPVRRNEQALCEVVDSAKKSLFIVSYVSCHADKVYDAIRAAIDRGVSVAFLLEASIKNDLDQLFPEASFYRWGNADSAAKSVMHAKCAVADNVMAMITSANLTGKAMEQNMELGVLIKGGRIPKVLKAHFEALVVEKLILEIH